MKKEMKIYTEKAKSRFSEFGWGNGYVGVTKGHPWYEVDYDEIGVSIHGGLTYADHWNCETQKITPNIWWIGFDTSHLMDNPVNCSESFVDSEIQSLQKQAQRQYNV